MAPAPVAPGGSRGRQAAGARWGSGQHPPPRPPALSLHTRFVPPPDAPWRAEGNPLPRKYLEGPSEQAPLALPSQGGSRVLLPDGLECSLRVAPPLLPPIPVASAEPRSWTRRQSPASGPPSPASEGGRPTSGDQVTRGPSSPGWWDLLSPGACCRCRRLLGLVIESVRGRTLPSRPFPFQAMSQTRAAQWPTLYARAWVQRNPPPGLWPHPRPGQCGQGLTFTRSGELCLAFPGCAPVRGRRHP